MAKRKSKAQKYPGLSPKPPDETIIAQAQIKHLTFAEEVLPQAVPTVAGVSVVRALAYNVMQMLNQQVIAR